jgi:hypothetical protein
LFDTTLKEAAYVRSDAKDTGRVSHEHLR